VLKKSTSWAVLIYGLLLIGLGYYGYYMTGSMISLYSGGGFGIVLVICSLFMFGNIRWASYIALSATLILTALFSIRYSMTGKGLPATLAVLSAGMLLFLLAQTTKWKR
jgi:uncharacterized membrane protein (UPF0136 family)